MAENNELYSSRLRALEIAAVPEPISQAIEELQAATPIGEVKWYHWNGFYMAAALEVSVDLPTRGPVNDIDIRPVEPILILFHGRRYPRKAPLVYSDRKDFPSALLPHLNPTRPGTPAWLCLHRGSLDDWFAEHSLCDFLCRIRSWLRDAGRNRLIREDDRFEGTRVEDPIGLAVYRPSDLISVVGQGWRESGGASGHRFLWATLLNSKEVKKQYPGRFSVRIKFVLHSPPEGNLVELFTQYNTIATDRPELDKLLFGLLVWTPRQEVCEYFGHLPSSYGELKEFCKELGIELERAVDEYRLCGAQMLGGVPILLAILRPQLLIGAESPVEILNFILVASHEYRQDNDRLKDEAPVFVMSHRNPLTVDFASKMSREEVSGTMPLAIVGCGAVGSKLSLHLAKAGHVNQVLIDEADLSPHHLVRHGLSSQYVGKNKAEALKEEIASIYVLDQNNLKVEAKAVSSYDLLEEQGSLAGVQLLVDATASSSVLNALTEKGALPHGLQCCRCEIADWGRLGLLLWEGRERNPRLDDLQAFLFDYGKENSIISAWLSSYRKQMEEDRGSVLEEIGIGVSCSSTTLRLADDVVSYHASCFSLALKRREQWKADDIGRIQLSFLVPDKMVLSGTQTLVVPSVTVISARVRTDWEVRVHANVIKRIHEWMARVRGNETGGLLLGLAHRKRKTIYVTDALPPSKDSKGTPYAFKRGVKDYPKILDRIESRTGGLIGYVGEWHTHPGGRADLSDTDLRAVEAIRSNLESAGLPTHIMVFGSAEVASFVFLGDE